MKIYLTLENLKQSSLSSVLSYVMENGVCTRREIQRATGFSWGTVSENANELISRGYLIEERDTSKSGAGRKGFVLKINGDSVVSIGLDINKSGLEAKIVGFDRSVKESIYRNFDCQTQNEVLESAFSLCDSAFDFCKDRFRVLSIGVAFQGSVDAKGGISLRFPLKSGWEPTDIKSLFEERYEVLTFVDHDPKCMLFSKSLEEEMQNLMLVRIDKSIGLSVMQDGKLLADTDRLELAHTLAVYDGLLCGCGRRGCLDAYSSINGLCERCSADFNEILNNREKYKSELSEAAVHLATALFNTSMLFYPDKIILAGKLISHFPEFLDEVSEIFIKLRGEKSKKQIEICSDTNISAAFGAAVWGASYAVKQLKI